MPAFSYKHKVYNNPVEFVLERIGGKWKIPILWRLNQRPYRYGELKTDLKRVTHKMLAQQLRELQEDGLIDRKVHASVPPRVDYTITKCGREAIPSIEAMRKLGRHWMRVAGIEVG